MVVGECAVHLAEEAHHINAKLFQKLWPEDGSGGVGRVVDHLESLAALSEGELFLESGLVVGDQIVAAQAAVPDGPLARGRQIVEATDLVAAYRGFPD